MASALASANRMRPVQTTADSLDKNTGLKNSIEHFVEFPNEKMVLRMRDQILKTNQEPSKRKKSQKHLNLIKATKGIPRPIR